MVAIALVFAILRMNLTILYSDEIEASWMMQTSTGLLNT